jgi:hypothetical protein
MARPCNVILTALLLAATCFGAPALASQLAGALQRAQAEKRLTPEEASGIETGINEAAELGLPRGPFVAKVEEGLAKRVPGPAIIQALETMRGDYAFARDVLARGGTKPSPDDIAQTGESLRLGLTRQELTGMAGLEPPAPPAILAIAARTRAGLNAVGFPSSLSDGILGTGLSAGLLTPGWEQLFRIVQRTRASGVPDSDVAAASVRVMAGGGGPGEVLQELGLTGRDTRQAPGRQN